ncbi:FtsX-like permease family protein [Candidatus Poribacteria bacterium]|nr:FtsX-like permease family protein [Candidatus Poribacteria bacterium]
MKRCCPRGTTDFGWLRRWIAAWTLCFLAGATVTSAVAQRAELALSQDAEMIRRAVRMDNIKRDIARLSALETRVTGYPASDSAAKYVFDRFQSLGLTQVDSRTFSIAVPIDQGTGRLVVQGPDGVEIASIPVRGLWPNLVRAPFLANGLQHKTAPGDTLDSIAHAYRVDATAIVDDPRNDELRNQRQDGLDNDNDGLVDDADLDGEITPVAGSNVFIPTGGMTGRLVDGKSCRLADFNRKPVGGFWYPVQSGDSIESIARQFRVAPGSIVDDVLNVHLSRSHDGIDNNGDGVIDEYGEIEPTSVIQGWARDGVDNDRDGLVDETASSDRAGVSEAAVFVPRGAVVLADFNSGTEWINAAMLGAQAILFVEPDETIRGEAEDKFLTVPANIPRFWVAKSDAAYLRSLLGTDGGATTEATVQLTADVRWEKRTGQNIQGLLPGSDPVLRDELIVVQGYYDSMSVVPTLAPGAETTAGIATIFELIRLLNTPEFQPARSVLFLATGAHFQGLSGMRAFMEGISQDNVSVMREIRDDLKSDVIEFQEFGRRIALSLDRGYLVEFRPSFHHRVNKLSSDLDALVTSLNDLSRIQGQIDGLASSRQAAKEQERTRRIADLSKNRDRQEFTEEERARLEVSLARAKASALQTAQFLKEIVRSIAALKAETLAEARKTEHELLTSIALPIAKVDVWAVQRLIAQIRSGEIGGAFERGPESSLLPYTDPGTLPAEAVGTMSRIDIPGFGAIDPAASLNDLRPALEGWEVTTGRIAEFYTPYRLLQRHLTAAELGRIRAAQATLHGRTSSQSSADLARSEIALLRKAASSVDARGGDANPDAEAIRNAENSSYRQAQPLLERYLTEDELRALKPLYRELSDAKARDIALGEIRRYLNIAARQARMEKGTIGALLASAEQGVFARDFRPQELLALRNHLSDGEYVELLGTHAQTFAEHEREALLTEVERRAFNDVLELEQLRAKLPALERDFVEDEKRLLRNNLLTLRNSRLRNVHKRIERVSRIDGAEYERRIANVVQAVQLQDELNRYYQSLVVSVDLSTQGSQLGVFYKGWFYNDNREFELRREFAPIGNKLVEYATNASLKQNIEALRRFPDDYVRQAVLSSQWAIADRLDKVEALEGKTLETLVFSYYDQLASLGGVSRLMKLQFEDMRQKGEPSQSMLKDMDYIRKEVERLVRNDVREARRSRKSTQRLFARVERMLALRSVPVEDLSDDEINDIKTLMVIAGITAKSNFVNAISASGGKTWQTYVPGKIAFDSEVATLSGKTGIAFATVDDSRVLTDTPLDTYGRLNYTNLQQQVETLASLMIQVLRDPKMPTSARVGNFYCTLSGRVLQYDARESAVPQTPVRNALVAIRQQNKTMMGVRGDLFVLGDQKGKYDISGLAMEGRATSRPGGTQETEAYVLDPESGDIVYAPDLGNYGAKIYPNKVAINRRLVGAPIVVFPCVSTTIYDLVDQRYLRTLTQLEVYDADRDAPPERYGISRPWVQPMVSSAEPIALVYSEPGSRIKVSMASGLLGKLLLLIKATATNVDNPTLYTGEGFVVRENGSIRVTPYVVVQDMWNLDQSRIALYQRYGISNKRLEELHADASTLLGRAEQELSQANYSDALKLARASWGNESIAYPDVKATGNDVVRGVMFYLFLLLPFAFFLERLLFAFTNINKRIGATFGIFLLVFFFLSRVHPAFEIAETPFIILIAFVVLALTIVVISIIIRKFNEQLEKMKREKSKIYKADVGRLSASAAAFSLGISNMRKRRGRTMLTCATLVVLTFTVISFTSVRSEIRANATRIPGITPVYQGVLVRDQYWRTLEEPVLTGIRNDFKRSTVTVAGEEGREAVAVTNSVAPRAWYESASIGNQSSVLLENRAGDKSYAVNMLIGMSPEEPRVTRIDSKLVYGRWFAEGEDGAYVTVLPKGVADSLGVTEEDVINGAAAVRLLGAEFKVVGVLGIDFKELTDLDGEELTPVDYQLLQQQQSRGAQDSTLEGELQKYQHLPPDAVAILPYDIVMSQGGNLKSIAVNMEDPGLELPSGTTISQKIDATMGPLMKRSALDFFVGKGRNVHLYSSIGATSTEQMSNLFIPVLIAALIVLNTMLGAVYERVREIGIYSAVGLAPVHIAFLFIAEACVYAVLGAVLGYLLGQITAWTLVQTGWLAGLTLNYSARSTVYATMIVMMVVLGSTMYPAIKAGRMAVPDIERKWRLPDPDGDEWNFDLPFTVLGEEALGLNIFMRDYFEAHADESASDFYTENVAFQRLRQPDGAKDNYAIEMMVWLAPYDLGVSQRISLQTSPVGGEEEDLYRIHLTVFRESGEIASWKRVNRRFLNLIRKQLLIWRTFNVELRGEFHARGREETQRLAGVTPEFASD